MPNIIELRAPATAPEPTDIAATTAREAGAVENRFAREAGTSLGGAISRVGGQVGAEIDDHLASQAISHGSAVSSQAFADLSQQWNTLREKTDPNDTSIAAGFNEKVYQPWADNFLKQFESSPRKARDWAAQHVESMRRELFHTITADMGTRAADAAHQNIVNATKADAFTARNSPSHLDFLFDKAEADTKAQTAANPYLNAAQQAKINEVLIPARQNEIAKGAIMGMARTNPQALLENIESGGLDKYLKNPEMREWAMQFTRERIRDKHVDDNYAYEQKKRAEHDLSETGKGEYVQKILHGQPLGDYGSDARLSPEAKENVFSFQHTLTMAMRDKKATERHPQNMIALLDQIRQTADAGQPTSDKPIFDALKAGKINPTGEFQEALNYYARRERPIEKLLSDQSKVVEHALTTGPYANIIKLMDPEDYASRVLQMQGAARKVITEAEKRGETDMTPYTDPDSPKWMYKGAKGYFGLAPKKAIADQAEAVRKGEVDVAAEREKAVAAIAGGKEAGQVRARFKERTGLDFDMSAVNPDVTKQVASAEPRTFEEFVQQQDALRPAVEAKGWQWQPDRWNYFINDKGQIDREGSPGRAYMQRNWAATTAFKTELDKLKPK
jgi:hypothetical protein